MLSQAMACKLAAMLVKTIVTEPHTFQNLFYKVKVFNGCQKFFYVWI